MKNITFVFDIDDTLALHFEQKEWKAETAEISDVYGKDFLEKHTVTAVNYPHFIFPGIPELWRWLHGMGHNFALFSSAVKERNQEFADKFITLIFGEQAAEIRPAVKVFSREDCFDTYRMGDRQREFQPVFFGNKKKVLSGVVVPPAEMPWTFLIDDDRSYMALNEEYNYIRVQIDMGLHPNTATSAQDHQYLYKAFYLAGLLQDIFSKMEKDGMTATEAAKFVQIDSVDQPFDSGFFYPTIEEFRFYQEGDRILSSINTETKIPPAIMQRMEKNDYRY